jgi:WD40 repeat protein
VWSCAFHDTGDFVASGSLDHTTKLFDLHRYKISISSSPLSFFPLLLVIDLFYFSMRCRQTLRGHMDSVNSIEFLPYPKTKNKKG